MRAWPSTDVPELPVLGPAVRVYDSSRRAVVAVSPVGDDGVARLYVCGITPYDATHIGHASTYLAFDLLNRAWRSAGHPVRYVQNVTDVDDPLLERAQATGVDWRELAERETELFRTDMAALGVLPPDAYIGAVEAIDTVVEMIQELQKKDTVYRVDDDLYFSVTAAPGFGEVSGWEREEMLRVFPERGGDPDRAGKRDALDCLVWQAERPDDPSWSSALGPGRPGWHIECAAIARAHLEGRLDVQGGGSDLLFPHHEMSAAEAEVVDEQPFAQAYVHAGMV
ncbi:MAG: class I tRNA ligase family protein, partial [Marmoricola sp.]